MRRLGPKEAGVAVFYILLATGVVACRRPSQQAVPTPDGPASALGTGSCDFDLSGAKADTVLFALGMLDEYLGRQSVEHSDLIEGFYCNERATASLFRGVVNRLANEQDLDPAVREETVQGCLTRFYSKPITERINSCYNWTFTGSLGPRGRNAIGSLDPRVLGGGNQPAARDALIANPPLRRRALAYLAGAWARSGRDSVFVFVNAHAKAERIGFLLLHLDCGPVSIERFLETIPQGNTVHFRATDEVTTWLHKDW